MVLKDSKLPTNKSYEIAKSKINSLLVFLVSYQIFIKFFVATMTYSYMRIQITFVIELLINWYILYHTIEILSDFLFIDSSIPICDA